MVPLPMDYYAKCLSMVTGQEYTLDRLYWMAERTETLIRMFNCREGFQPEGDQIPARILLEPLQRDHAKGQNHRQRRVNKMLG